MVGRPFASLMGGPYTESKALAGLRDPTNVEIEIRTPSGERVPCTASLTPLPERPGRNAGFGVILTGALVSA
jgi:hypothetical protein